jgi:tyrosyl-tRNA synthetase
VGFMEYSQEVVQEAKRQFEILKRGVVEITPEDEFMEMLCDSIHHKRPLRVKCGIDPTRDQIHLGHTVPYKKMRAFQDLGHLGVVIIGDYTASIGDPTGRNEARPSLDLETVKKNAERYMEQVYTVIDPKKTEICHQSEWFADVGLSELLKWAGQTTVAKLLSHETFKDRLNSGNPLSLHELFYPLLQGVDSVFCKADVELGGTDQKFNVLMGRDYQKANEQRLQVAMLLPLITGTCGGQKMSKSLNNTISVVDEPFDMFGKIMSVPDSLIVEYFTYLTDKSLEEIAEIEAGLEKGLLHPNEVKKDLASTVVDAIHPEGSGPAMRQKFEDVFKRKNVPDDIPETALVLGKKLVDALMEAGLVTSKGEARRLIKQKAIGIVDGEKVEDTELSLDESFQDKVVKVGKRKFLKFIS